MGSRGFGEESDGWAYRRVRGRVAEFFADESVGPLRLLVAAAGVDAGDDERHGGVLRWTGRGCWIRGWWGWVGNEDL